MLGAVIIAVGIYLRPEPQNEGPGTLTTATTPGRQYIASQDSDGDGIKDWEEELQKKVLEQTAQPIPEVAGEELEDTYTAQFARSFFEDFVEAKIPGSSPQNQEEFINSAVASIEASTESKLYTRADVKVIDTSDFAIKDYGNRVADVVINHSIEKKEEEALILKRALDDNDPEALKGIGPIKIAYKEMLEETKKISVPEALVKEHLLLLNSYQAMYDDLDAMEQTFTDPLYTIARIKRYEEDSEAFVLAFINMSSALDRLNVTFDETEPGALFELFRT